MTRAFRGLSIADATGALMAFIIAAGCGWLFFVPVGMWFKVGALEAHSAARWEDVRVAFDRKIVQPFAGTWRAEIDRAVPGGWEQVCATDLNHQTYTPDMILPNDGLVSLEWFTGDPACYLRDDTGHFRLRATWVVNPDSFLGLTSRSVERVATFEVVPPR